MSRILLTNSNFQKFWAGEEVVCKKVIFIVDRFTNDIKVLRVLYSSWSCVCPVLVIPVTRASQWWLLPTCRSTPRQFVPNTNKDAFYYTRYNPLTLSFSCYTETPVLQTSSDQIFSHSNNSNLTSVCVQVKNLNC